MFSTPSGNFGNLTAGLMAKRAGMNIRRFVAATNVNDVVPEYLVTGQFTPRPSIHTLANAMDVGNPSNFDRMMWLYGRDLDAIRRDVTGSRHDDDEVRATIRKVYEERGYLLDPHSAIAYLGLKSYVGSGSDVGSGFSRTAPGVFLATAHPGEVRRGRRADHRPRDPEAEAAGGGAGDGPEDPGDRRDARGGREGPCLITCIARMCCGRWSSTASCRRFAPLRSSLADSSATCIATSCAFCAIG